MSGLNISQYQIYNTTHNYSALFSGMNKSSAANGWDLSGLADYASIRNGSYGKLMRAHYSSRSTNSINTDSGKNSTILTADQRRANREARLNKGSSVTDSTNTSTTIAGTNGTTATTKKETVQSAATSLAQSAQALQKSELWQKKDITTKDAATGTEKTTNDYDREAITKAIQTFVKDYNSVMDQAADSTSNSVLRSAVNMKNVTDRTASRMLSKAGVTVGSDNKLVVNEEKLAKADISELKSLFYGSGSFADKIAEKAGVIAREASVTNPTYTSSASRSDVLSELLDGKIDLGI